MTSLHTNIHLRKDELYEFVNDFKNVKNNQYIITSYGDVYNNLVGYKLNPGLKNGYPTVYLMINTGKSLPIRVHLLVYKFFSGNSSYDPSDISKQIHHINDLIQGKNINV